MPASRPETAMFIASPKVVFLGSLNMDLLIQVARAPREGETVQGHSIHYVPGGKGANQAVSCARQGACVSLVGCVGSDHHGVTLLAALVEDRIAVDGVLIDPGEPTGVAMVMVDDNGQNRIVCIAGANARLRIDEEKFARQLTQAQFLVMQFEVPMQQVLQAAQIAHRVGCKVILNPSPMQVLPDELWPLVDTLIVNETEAQALTGVAPDDRPGTAARAAQHLRDRGIARVVVTLGKLGAVATDASGSSYHPAPAVRAIDTTAAGDTFLGAVTAALAEGQGLTASVESGIRAATLCVQTMGAQPSIPDRAAVTRSPSPPPWITL